MAPTISLTHVDLLGGGSDLSLSDNELGAPDAFRDVIELAVAGPHDVAATMLHDSDGNGLPQEGNVLPLPDKLVSLAIGEIPADPVESIEFVDGEDTGETPVIAFELSSEQIHRPGIESGLPHVTTLSGNTDRGRPAGDASLRLADHARAGEAYRELSDAQILPRQQGEPAEVSRTLSSGASGTNAVSPDTVRPEQGLNYYESMEEIVTRAEVPPATWRLIQAKSGNAPQQIQSTALSVDAPPVLQAPTQPAPVADKLPLQMSIDVPLLDPKWTDRLNERITWMNGNGIQRADIRVNPSELGPIRVELIMDDELATLNLSAQQTATRDALELAIPRLRELLNENGIMLADANISDTDVADDNAEFQAGDDTDNGVATSDDEPTQSSVADVRIPSTRLIDTFV